MASHFVWLNRNKESVCLDLKAEPDHRLLLRILGEADVFIQNLAPGAADRLGLSAGRLRPANPRLITCSISGYGTNGPYEERKAYDLMVQCESGLLDVTGTEEVPSKAGISVADISAGMYAFSGIMAALLLRDRTGIGEHVEVSMLDALAEWMGYPYYYGRFGGVTPPRTGARHATIAPYGPIPTLDGQQVFLAVQNQREWFALCERVLGEEFARDPRFVDNPARVRNARSLDAELRRILGVHSAIQLSSLLDDIGIANALLRDPARLDAHPQLVTRNRWRQVDTEVGSIPSLTPTGIPASVEPRFDPIPALGEHTASVREEFEGSVSPGATPEPSLKGES